MRLCALAFAAYEKRIDASISICAGEMVMAAAVPPAFFTPDAEREEVVEPDPAIEWASPGLQSFGGQDLGEEDENTHPKSSLYN